MTLSDIEPETRPTAQGLVDRYLANMDDSDREIALRWLTSRDNATGGDYTYSAPSVARALTRGGYPTSKDSVRTWRRQHEES